MEAETNETQGQRITRSMNASQQGEATMANEEQRKPGRPKKIRKPGRPKKIKPKPRIRVRNSPKGKRGRPPKPKLEFETELAEEMCTTSSSTAAATADADVSQPPNASVSDINLETCSSQRDQISLLKHQLAAANQKLKDALDCHQREKEALEAKAEQAESRAAAADLVYLLCKKCQNAVNEAGD